MRLRRYALLAGFLIFAISCKDQKPSKEETKPIEQKVPFNHNELSLFMQGNGNLVKRLEHDLSINGSDEAVAQRLDGLIYNLSEVAKMEPFPEKNLNGEFQQYALESLQILRELKGVKWEGTAASGYLQKIQNSCNKCHEKFQ